MLSFIIIGRNEGWKLTKCLESVFKAISVNSLDECEVIYVDSQSTDDSIDRAKKYKKIKILRITGKSNAAIARNAGAQVSNGDILCFIDGDMEIYPDFIKILFERKHSDYRFISGQLVNNYYDEDWNLLRAIKLLSSNKLDTFDVTNGGAFIIDKLLWQNADGMQTKYTRCEDIDLNYRLVKMGYKIYRYSATIVNHHTIDHDYNISLISDLKNNLQYYYFRGLLIRAHILNLSVLKDLLRLNYSLFFLLLIIITAILFSKPILIALYIFLISVRSIRRFTKFRKVIKTKYRVYFIKYIYQDVIAILSILFFYPRNVKTSFEIVMT